MRWWVSVLLIVMGQAAVAGPWLKTEKEGFVALGQSIKLSPLTGSIESHHSLYLEYGWRPKTTLVFNLGFDGVTTVSGHMSARRAVGIGHAHLKFAYEIGVHGTARFHPFAEPFTPNLRLGFSAGRGTKIAKTNGWAVADLEVLLGSGSASSKLDTTIGLSTERDWKWMAHATIEFVNDDWNLSLGPSVAIPLFNNNHLQLGATYHWGPTQQIGAKASLWRSF